MENKDVISFSEIIDLAIKNGFTVDETKNYNFLRLKREDGTEVEFEFSGNIPSDFGDNTAISWSYRLIDTNNKKELYKDYLEYYWDNLNQKIIDMKEDLRDFIQKITTLPIRVVKKPVLLIFKYKTLECEIDGVWTNFYGKNIK